jgi:hypothetical protein
MNSKNVLVCQAGYWLLILSRLLSEALRCFFVSVGIPFALYEATSLVGYTRLATRFFVLFTRQIVPA